MPAKPILYDYLFSGNSYKVRLLLSQLGMAYEHRAVDIIAGETAQRWFLEKNPAGQIPALELPDGTLLRESTAILMHLSEGTAFLPAEKLSRTRVLEWLCFEQSNVDRVISRARFRRAFPKAIPTREEEFGPWLRQGAAALRVMEAHLTSRTFFVDERYTVADIGLYAYTHCADEGGFDLSIYPNLQRWFARVAATPGYLPIDQVPINS
jgi:glutathione S-transferase